MKKKFMKTCYKCNTVKSCVVTYTDARCALSLYDVTNKVKLVNTSHGICEDCNDGTL